ncbi:MAG: hypothetical protein GF411_03950 [Candidatus Lokiarchaeota archaeon]|nr:hypothetical protein [Candidatus Lokiarchaeota archaeon]
MITTRKLNKVRNSFYVYLPRDWCDTYNLNKDSEVKIQQSPEGTLIVYPPEFEPKKGGLLKFVIDESNKDSVESMLIGAYIVGSAGIHIEFSEELELETREMISRWIRRLPGFEILEEHSQSITISEISEIQVVMPILKRQFATTKYMLGGLISSMESEDTSKASKILNRDEDVDRHRYFVERLCHLALQDPSYARKIDISPPECLHFSLAAKYIERIADHICGATEEFKRLRKIDDTLFVLAKKLAEVYSETMRMFFRVEGMKHSTKDVTESTEAFDSLHNATAIATKLSKLESSKKGPESDIVLFILHLQRVASYCADIGEVAINRIIQSQINVR